MGHSDRYFMRVILEAMVLLTMGLGLYQQSQKAALPDGVVRPLHSIGSTNVRDASGGAIEMVVDGYRIGESIEIHDSSVSNAGVRRVVLVPYHELSMILLVALIALVYFTMAVVVQRRRPEDLAARVLYALGLGFGLLIACSSASVVVLPPALSLTLRTIFFLAYVVSPSILLHFSAVFTENTRILRGRWLPVLYAIAILLALIHSYTEIMFFVGTSDSFDFYHISDLLVHVWFGLMGVGSLVLIVAGYRRAPVIAKRRQILWVLYGMDVSLVSYNVLWLLPIIFLGHPLVSEGVIVALAAVAPFTFSIAVLRYRALDIDVIVKLSVLHGTVIVLTITIYAIVVTMAIRIIGFERSVLEYVIPVFIVINEVLFAPVRGWIRRRIDSLFFRVQYDFRNAHRSIVSSIRESLAPRELAVSIHQQLTGLFQPTHILVCLYDLESHQPIEIGACPETSATIAQELKARDGTVCGRLLIGARRSQQNYTDEDVDLVSSVATEVVTQLERLRLHRSLLTEQERAEQASTQSKQKSAFVSSVSHDLKTPLTSIHMYAELLERHVQEPQAKRYLQMIEGESERLGRLVDNVLDFAKIERGIMEYDLSQCDVNGIVRRAAEMMEYLLTVNGFTVDIDITNSPAMASVASDALQDAVTNLLTNAIKYSGPTKHVAILTRVVGDTVVICIADKGIGIPKDQLHDVFLPFVRVKDSASQGAGGAGLGLALVKHVAEAHNGRVELESVISEGTTVRLILPLA